MDESVGKKLSKARLKRGLSIDEAAHATRLRPDKIAALENDDYSTFASNVYARGFLQIYGRFLEVDVADFASTLAGNSVISVEDYQYLNSNAPVRIEEATAAALRPQRRGPGLVALALFVVLLCAVGFGFHLYVNWQRIAGEPTPHKESASPAPGPASTAAAESHRAQSTAAASATPAPPMRAEVKAQSVSDRDFVAPAPPPATAAAANEVLVQPLRKTWIIVRKDDPNSPPIFEDYIYPDTPPLKLKGSRFFIEARDPTAIQIRKNGAPMAYQAPGVPVP